MLKNSSILFVVVVLIALPQFSETIYASIIPDIAVNFVVDQSIAEHTLVSFFIGIAVGTLMWGHCSDRIGRKNTILLGLSVYILATFLCLVSESIGYLVSVRFIHGIGTSVGSVMGQAIIRDMIRPENRPNAFSMINICMSFVPTLGLILGNMVVENFAWRWVFVVLIVIGVLIVMSAMLFIPRISMERSRSSILFSNCMAQILRDYKGLKLGFLVGGCMGLLFGFFAESEFYFMEKLRVSSDTYRIIIFFISAPLLIGGIISKKMQASPNKAIYLGIKILFTASLVFCVLVYFYAFVITDTLILYSILCVYLVLLSISLIVPNCLRQILEPYGHHIGTAASIFGFYYYIITALFIAIMSGLHTGSIKSLPLFFFICSIMMGLVRMSHTKLRLFLRKHNRWYREN